MARSRLFFRPKINGHVQHFGVVYQNWRAWQKRRPAFEQKSRVVFQNWRGWHKRRPAFEQGSAGGLSPAMDASPATCLGPLGPHRAQGGRPMPSWGPWGPTGPTGGAPALMGPLGPYRAHAGPYGALCGPYVSFDICALYREFSQIFHATPIFCVCCD